MRLFAGIYDLTGGWISANEYNMYEAVIEKDAPVAFQVAPYVDDQNELGIAFNIRF